MGNRRKNIFEGRGKFILTVFEGNQSMRRALRNQWPPIGKDRMNQCDKMEMRVKSGEHC